MVSVEQVKGFSERNIKLMAQFALEYPDAFVQTPTTGQQPVARLAGITNGQQLVGQIPWAHNVLQDAYIGGADKRAN